MNIQQIRQSLRLKWVNYYYKNRSWLVKVRVWGTYDGLRRPSSSFILATLSILEPQLEQLLPFLVELNNDPDEIVSALGLNFNPEEHSYLLNGSEVSHQVSNIFLQENLLNGISSNSSTATTEVERKNQSVTSSEVTTGTLYEDNSLTSNGIAIKEESQNQSLSLGNSCVSPNVESESETVEPVAVATLPVETNNISIPWFSYFSQEVTLQGKFFRSLDISTELEIKKNCTIPIAVATSERTSNSTYISNNVLFDKEGQRNCESHFVMDNNAERKSPFVTIPQEDCHKQENLLPKRQLCHLANWVDDFCQGKEWSAEELNPKL
ncbi:DUF5331 domain-containing protein [Scytonema sp. NUACC26]|uniref:DUF5331 domain-containing protein n=1 Tax=Scytonema sp. NUACC26 TaxID=3140176 RepID=UPI0034DBCDCF